MSPPRIMADELTRHESWRVNSPKQLTFPPKKLADPPRFVADTNVP